MAFLSEERKRDHSNSCRRNAQYRNPQLLAEAISKLVKDDALRERLVKKGQEFIKRYTWDSVGKNLERVYQKFLLNTNKR